MGIRDDDALIKSMETIETAFKAQADKADSEFKANGKISADTKTAIETIGVQQRTLADRLLALEQKGAFEKPAAGGDLSYGAQLVKSDNYANYVKAGAMGNLRVELKNTVTNAVGNTFSERKPFVEGAFRVFTIEDLLTSIPTTANSIDWVQEAAFTNAAAETAEGVAKPQSSVTTSLQTMPISTIAHWIKISRQLAADNAALAAYIDRRMVYGVNFRMEAQLVAGNGTAPNIGGLTKSGNFTAHGYTAAALTGAGLLNNRFDLIGKMLGDCALSDYPADVIILNTADWWTMRLAKDSQGSYLMGPVNSPVAPTLFGLPVVASNAMVVSNVWAGNLAQAATFHTREGVTVAMSEHDSDNFTTNLITIRAERRAALTVEKPIAARYGLLVPA